MSFTKAGQILVDSKIAEKAIKLGYSLGNGTYKQKSEKNLPYKMWEDEGNGFASISISQVFLGVHVSGKNVWAYIDFFWFNKDGGVTYAKNKAKVKQLLSSHPEWFSKKKYRIWGQVKKDEEKELKFDDINHLEKQNSFSLTTPVRTSIEDVCTDLSELLEIVIMEYNPPKVKVEIEEDDRYMETEDYSNYISLLKENHNIILHGAPGTGKTYLAKKIAQAMGALWQMVQFHPSYDYTDFVEGLRPTAPDANGQIGFVLKDGAFKSFCAKALPQNKSNFEDLYAKFLDSLEEDPEKEFKTKVKKCSFHLQRNSNDGLYVIPCTEIGTKMPLTKNLIRDYVENGNIRDWKSYLTVVGDAVKSMDKSGLKLDEKDVSKKDYVFIIDEINRGDMSKIFGELFYSIDPGYRGPEGRVKTQYANMAESSPNDFDLYLQSKNIVNTGDNGYFFIPENVYIIGTMNDIDRSVESMDFAMRRRFTFEEVTAEQSSINFKLDDCAKDVMSRLNTAISTIQGLNLSYHIGAAYFKDFKEDTDKELFWNRRLKGLLTEYLRGTRNFEDNLNKLKDAFMKMPIADQFESESHNSES